MDFALFAAMQTIEAAENGDLTPMIKRLEDGELLPSERTWLAGYLRGEKKRKQGRKAGSQTKHNTIKKRFETSKDIDLAVWDAHRYLIEWEGKTEPQSKDEIASIIGETRKSIEQRLDRISKHLEAGGRRSDYVFSLQSSFEAIREIVGSPAETYEAMAAVMRARGNEVSPPPLPLLLAWNRK